MVKLKAGDVILCPKEKTEGIYTFLQKLLANFFKDNTIAQLIGRMAIDYVAKIYGHNYIHAEIYLGNGILMGAWFNGTHVWEPPLEYFVDKHIYRPKYPVELAKIIKAAKKEFNKPYDFASLIQNALIEIASVSSQEKERELEKIFVQLYDSPEKVICSELVARILAGAGVLIEPTTEFVTPDDIAQSENLMRIL